MTVQTPLHRPGEEAERNGAEGAGRVRALQNTLGGGAGPSSSSCGASFPGSSPGGALRVSGLSGLGLPRGLTPCPHSQDPGGG